MVWAVPRSLATTYGITFVFFSSAYLDVSVQRVCSSFDVTGLQPDGLPHSDICGSSGVCPSPQLFAAYHVLLRLWEPRHPPYALNLLMYEFFYLNFTVYSIKKVLFFFFLLFVCVFYCNMSMNGYLDIKYLNSWRISESNRWPPACKAGALASWANPPFQNLKLWMLNFELDVIHTHLLKFPLFLKV